MPTDDTPTKEQAREDVQLLAVGYGCQALNCLGTRGNHKPGCPVDTVSSRLSHLEAENERLERERDEARAELKDADKLIRERDRILDALPCPRHWKCVPHVLDWISSAQAQLERLREDVELLDVLDRPWTRIASLHSNFEWIHPGTDVHPGYARACPNLRRGPLREALRALRAQRDEREESS